MTRDEIRAMGAGRKLDALVAEKVMEIAIVRENGLPVMENSFHDPRLIGIGGQRMAPPLFSTDIAAAWGIVEHLLKTDKRSLQFRAEVTRSGSRRYAKFCVAANGITSEVFGASDTESIAPAICRAALIATNGD